MRLPNKSVLGVSAAALMIAASAHAQEGAVNVTTGAETAKLGGEFRAELKYDNNQLYKETGYTPKAATTLDVNTAKVKLKGNLNKETEYAFRFNINPTATSPSPFDYGYGTHWFGETFGWSFGKMKVVQGGWDQLDGGFKDHAVGQYRAKNLPFADYSEMMAFHVKAAGKLSLQVLNDYTKTSADPNRVAEWNSGTHPTYALGWAGDFNGIMPLVDFGTFDNQKSRWFDVGIKAKLAGVDASLDFGQKTVGHKVVKASDPKKNDNKQDTATNIALRAGYEIAGAAKPWLYFSTYDNKQHTKDVKGNKVVEATATSPASYGWKDNGQTIGVGADLLSMGKNWNPYLAVVMQSGKFLDATGDKATSHNNMQVRFGSLAEF